MFASGISLSAFALQGKRSGSSSNMAGHQLSRNRRWRPVAIRRRFSLEAGEIAPSVHIVDSAGMPLCLSCSLFIPKCRWFPFFVWCIFGSRAFFLFLIDDGAEMMVASTMLPSFSSPPRSAR